MKLPCILAASAALSLLAGCHGGADINISTGCSPTSVTSAATVGTPLTGTSFAYQLQGADPSAIAATHFQVMVMDYSADGTAAGAYTAQQIASLHHAGKLALAYVSIGEAESYRYYFSPSWLTGNAPSASAPCWLGHVNPDWPGNFAARYWSEDWQQLILKYMDKVVAQGFDGVYLDKVDEFQYWSDPNNGDTTELAPADAARYMIAFVRRIADHVRNGSGKPGFLIVPQNGEDLLSYDADGAFLQTVSGLGVEDLFYDATVPVAADETAFRESLLDRVANAGRGILVTDYVDDGSGYAGANKARIDDFIAKTRAAGYIPYAARSDRALDSLNIIPGVQE
ncbi:MAG TPA: MJ1477/TM1410 family putative glycoside hydrolase [Gammaproteobacteria bacterium]|nr:MJ1477/TM1410 family putative glycoside hydrolase [Gammaproteobacteria bacterium]